MVKIIALSLLFVVLAVGVLARSHNSNEREGSVRAKVVGGSNAQPNAAPYQVSIRYTTRNQHFCGGSIIDTKWILTAAHCIIAGANEMHVVVGSNKLNSGGVEHKIAQIIQNKDYNAREISNDIALLKLEDDITYNESVGPIPLATKSTGEGVKATLTGWGFTSFPSNTLPNDLQILEVYTISLEKCKQNLRGYKVYESNICTYLTEGKGGCKGDSGGPLVANGELIGVVSWGIPCAKGRPDLYANVFYYRQWIKDNSGL